MTPTTMEPAPTQMSHTTPTAPKCQDVAEKVIRQTFADRPGRIRIVHVWNDQEGCWFRVNWYAFRPGFGQCVADSELVCVGGDSSVEIRTKRKTPSSTGQPAA